MTVELDLTSEILDGMGEIEDSINKMALNAGITDTSYLSMLWRLEVWISVATTRIETLERHLGASLSCIERLRGRLRDDRHG